VLWSAVLLTLWGLGNASCRRLVEVRLPVADLSPGLEGLRIAQVSDLHLGLTLGRRFAADVVAEVYVSRGAGYWGPPLRVLAPAEVTVLELVRG
jgi:predicted MPP superfamily phosphohydrolase